MSEDGKRRPKKIVCETLRVERSSYYPHEGRQVADVILLKRGPKTAIGD